MANVIEFTIRGIDKFSGPLGKVSRTLGTVTKTAAAVASAAVAAGGAFALFINRVANAEDQAGKFAQRLGENVEQLTALQFAADQSGIQVNTLNLAVQRSTRRIAEAAQGSGEAKDAIKELGLNARELSELPLDQRMAQIADAFQGVGNNADRTRLAFKLFDSEGVSMIQMLEGGSDAMSRMAQDAAFLGAVISQEAAANAAEFTNETGRLNAAIGGVSREIADVFIPLMTTLTRVAANTLAGMREAVGNAAEATLKGLVGAFLVAKQVIQSVEQDIDALSTAQGWDNLFAAAVDVFVSIGELAIRQFKRAMNAWVDLIRLAFNTMISMAKTVISSIFTIFTSGAKVIALAFTVPFTAAFNGITDLARTAWNNIQAIFKGEETTPLGIAFFQGFLESARETIGSIELELNNMMEGVPTIGEAIIGLSEDTAGNRQALIRDFQLFFNATLDEGVDAAEGIGDAFGVNLDLVSKDIDTLIQQLSTTGTVSQRSMAQVSDGLKEIDRASKETEEEIKEISESAIISALQVTRTLPGIYQTVAVAHANLVVDMTTRLIEFQEKIRITTLTISDSVVSVMEQTRNATAQAFVSILRDGLSFKGAMERIFESMVDSIIDELAKIAANKVFSQILDILTSGGFSIGGGSFFGGGLFGSILGGIGSIFGGIFHGGIEHVPREGTYLLQRGERVLSASQNTELMDMMRSGSPGASGGGSMSIGNASFHFFENARDADAMLRMSREQWREVIARKIIPAMNDLDRSGVRPVSIERAGR